MHRRNDATISSLRAVRKSAIAAFDELSRAKNEELADYFYCKFTEGHDLPFDVLADVPADTQIALPVVHGGVIVTTRKYRPEPNMIEYWTDWSAGSTLVWHYHSDCVENIEVKQGALKLYTDSGNKTLMAGDTAMIARGLGHQITALETTKIKVTFVRSQI